MGRRAGAAAASAAVMAQCVQSVQELIPDSFVPCVAALCSDEAERLTRLNHLSFAELLKPFSRLTSEGMWSPLFTELPQSWGREREVGGGQGREGRCLHPGAGRVALGWAPAVSPVAAGGGAVRWSRHLGPNLQFF